MIKLDEYVYKVDELLPSKNVEADIENAIQGTKIFNYVTPILNGTYYIVPNPDAGDTVYSEYTGYSGYTLVQVSGSTTLDRVGYPVDELTGLPRKIISSDGSMYFQKGAGWYKQTLDHRSPDILDNSNSDLTSRIKTIKTMSKPFTYGEDYFNVYRNLPGLDYGYTLSSEVDNVKTEFVQDENASKLTLNRKNANIFLSADRTIDYDIYRKSRNIPISFYTLTPQTGTTFADFLNNVLSTLITNSNTVKYKDGYFSLSKIYKTYQESVGFTPYQYISINDFISRMGPYWVNIIEQFIPATTLWMAGNVIENGIFNRSKFKHKLPFRNLGGCGKLYL